MRRLFFIVTCLLIAVVYYIGASLQLKHMEAFSEGIQNTIYALTGRNSEGEFIETTIEEIEEEETPYYWPALPKETEKGWMEQE